MACSWSKQPIWQGGYINAVNDAVIGGQLTTAPNNIGSQGQQTLPGDHLVLDEAAAVAASNTTTGTVHGGYFQYVQLDPAMLLATGALNQTITVTAAGTGYATATTTVSFTAAPAGGTTAAGYAVINSSGGVQAIILTNQGAGYLAAPTVTITGAGASATATATLVTANSALIAGQALYWKNTGVSSTGIYTVSNIQTLNTPNLAGFLLNPSWTPGNYSWIQTAGRVTALVDAASTPAITPGSLIYLSAATGTSNASVTSATGTVGTFVGIAEGYLQATPTAGSTTIVDVQKQTFRF